MIVQISGQVIDVRTQSVVLEANQIGYEVHTPDALIVSDEIITLYTHQAIRENSHTLYGFTKKISLEVFEALLTLPKVGPKTALTYLTQANTELIIEAIKNEDSAHLSKLSGITKKSAEKIVTGLKDKFDNYELAGASANTQNTVSKVAQNDVTDALIALGYPPQIAHSTIQGIMKDSETEDTQTLIKLALQQLNIN